MAEIVRMPKLSDTMTDGVVASWHKKVGDKIKAGDLLADIETDKATMEFESFQEGVLLYIGVEAGKTAPVDSILAILGVEGEDFSAFLSGSPSNADVSVSNEVLLSNVSEPLKSSVIPNVSSPSETIDERIKVSPLARKIANEKGIDLNGILGSGDQGRIVKKDIETIDFSLSEGDKFRIESSAIADSYSDFPVSQMRKTIARRLAESKFGAPHFYLTMDIDMDAAVHARKELNERLGLKISINDMIIKSVALALFKHPEINSSWLGDVIRVNHNIHIGVAVAVPDGLVVPVIRNANAKTLSQISTEVRALAVKAKDKKLSQEEMQGNTFSISNLGMFGIESFTAIINPPDACILAVGGIREEVVVKHGEVVAGNRMKVTLSCDHRVVDGAKGASFLQTFKDMLEQPLIMLA
jgi:pyruvate dehydrogenase E2 component (dihydrolipoamide acetyltransferase)